MCIVFHELSPVVLKNRKRLKIFINELFIKEGKTLASLNIIFCSDEYLLTINQQHLKHNFYTDIITFDLSESKDSAIVGELYISVDRVKDNTKKLNVTILEELHRVVFHGVLHLCGFKDKIASEIKTMRIKEEEYLRLYFNN